MTCRKERTACSAVFHAGRFHVISGRCTSEPGARMTCAESLDPVTLQWDPMDNEFLEASASKYHWVMGNGEGDVYQLGQNVTFRRGDTREWQLVAELPNQLQQDITCAMTWRDKMVVIGGTHSKAYTLDLRWTQRDLPYQTFSAGCALDL